MPYFRCPHCNNPFFADYEIKLKVDRGGYILKTDDDKIIQDKCKEKEK